METENHLSNYYAQTANLVYKYKNIKTKLTKTSLNIKFNKMCQQNNITPKYAQITIKNNNNSIAILKTQTKARSIRIKEEIKSLYYKKTKLNSELYKLHLELYNTLHYITAEKYIKNINKQIIEITNILKIKHKNKILNLKSKQNTPIPNCTFKFYPRLSNKTNIQLTNNEIEILNKGLSFNIQKTNKNQIIHEVINAEAAIKSLPTIEAQNEARTTINKKLKQKLKNKITNTKNNIKQKQYLTNLNNIKQKLIDNQAIVTKADKGNTIVILNQQDYYNKSIDFIKNNNIKEIKKDPTKSYVKQINNIINQSNNLFQNNEKNKLKQPNAKAPQFTGLPKIHKPDTPIRPLINYKTAPCYKIAKVLQKVIKANITIVNNNSLKNNLEIIEKTKNLNILPQHKLISLDVTNMYTNIPIDITIEIIKENLTKTAKINQQKINEIIKLLEIILKQNYFTFNNLVYTQEQGLAMGSPLSGLIADIYLNYFENKFILSKHNPLHKQITFYARYVDDTFLVFNGTNRQIDILNKYINNINKNIQFTIENEKDNSINFLDLNIKKQNNKLQYSIYRKPTTTDITIHNDSHHPTAQKQAAYIALINRLLNVPMTIKKLSRRSKHN